MYIHALSNYPAGDISQYGQPQNYELIGKRFDFAMDDGIDYSVTFLDKSALEWSFEGETPRRAAGYLCVKADDLTYLVSYVLEGEEPRANHTFVIDLENQLVTRIISRVGENPRYPYLITPRYEFGAIRQGGAEVALYPRHGYTNDMIGNVVQWKYGDMMERVHVYYCANYYRIIYPPEQASSYVFNEALAGLPSRDEPTAYIKIKDGVYLFSLTEQNTEKLVGDKLPYRSNTMCFLQNYHRVSQVGRSFGTFSKDGVDAGIHITFGACGKVIGAKEEYLQKLLRDPNPFLT
ncbi:MAG: MoaF N-terminal domain-containing protein [Oscillospiraceae bacterium]|jgi:hypothetical protein|nr:MoaF N-terminal domain-containing protein [Oscillospiraceae bacterium]